MTEKGNFKFIGLLESLALKVGDMDKKLDELRTAHVIETKSNIAVLMSRVSRLESIVYGCIGIITVQGIALLFNFFKHG